MTGVTSPDAFVKIEPHDFSFSGYSQNDQNKHANMSQQFGSWQGNGGNVDPSQLNNMNGQNHHSYNQPHSLSSSYIQGQSTLTDDDLLGSLGGSGNEHFAPGAGDDFNHAHGFGGAGFQQMEHSQPQHFHQPFSSTPDGAPIRSPFTHNNFDYNGWQSMRAGSSMQGLQQPMHRPSLQQQQQHMSSISRSPMTPMTPAMGNLNVGTPESSAISAQQSMPAHRRSTSQQWDNSLGSGYSYLDSPMASPNPAQHPQISEVLKSGASVASPSFGSSATGAGGAKVRSLEDKKAKRRASHNEVERKRRNNINNQITTLSRLVPGHRLEDDNIRRALTTNASLPAHLTAANMSPPNGSSLLSGSAGRRGVGSITQGLPIDDKDKAPAKGDVLNSSVGWMRDLMWLLNRMMQRESILQETIENLGGQMPIQITDDENRMRSEVLDAFTRNDVDGFDYSRKHGSNLWVPNHTDPTGQPISSVSPDGQLGNRNGSQDQSFWAFQTDANIRASTELKEEDEYSNLIMDME